MLATLSARIWAALARAPGAVEIITDLCDARMRFLRGLGTWPTFGGGWTRRVAEVEAAAVGAV